MLVRVVYGIGRYASIGISCLAMFTAIIVPISTTSWSTTFPLVAAVLVGGIPVTVVVHEAGHFFACRAIGARVTEISLGNERWPAFRFAVRGVKVSLSWPGSGYVRYEAPGSTPRSVFITVAGSLTNVVTAGIVAALAWPGHVALLGLAGLMAAIGLANLMPYRAPSGRLTDGARLLARCWPSRFAPSAAERQAGVTRAWVEALRAFDQAARTGTPDPEQTSAWLAGFHRGEPRYGLAAGAIARSLRRQGRTRELLELHASLTRPDGPFAGVLSLVVNAVAMEVLLLPGLPPEVTPRVARQVVSQLQWVLDNAKFEPGGTDLEREAVLHTLALGKLRQGEFAAAEELCWPLVELPGLPDADRATVLATIVLARRALGRPYQQALDEALALAPDADLVAEAAEAAATADAAATAMAGATQVTEATADPGVTHQTAAG